MEMNSIGPYCYACMLSLGLDLVFFSLGGAGVAAAVDLGSSSGSWSASAPGHLQPLVVFGPVVVPRFRLHPMLRAYVLLCVWVRVFRFILCGAKCTSQPS